MKIMFGTGTHNYDYEKNDDFSWRRFALIKVEVFKKDTWIVKVKEGFGLGFLPCKKREVFSEVYGLAHIKENLWRLY